MKIACISLGCPKNQVDLDGMVHILLSAGHETVAELSEADVILVNTCGFIESAKTEAIENILEACSYKQQNPDLKVIVTGCLAERYRSQIEEEIPGTVKLAGTNTEGIYRLAAELLDDPAAYDRMAKAVNPYGDGKACPRIAQAILSHFLDAQPPEPFVPAH